MKMPSFLRSTLCAAALLAAAIPCQAAPEGPSGWWNDAVFYQIMVRTFADSTTGPLANDGIGDVQGMVEKLDYLNDGNPATTKDLGVTALWLLPMSEASSDAGYSVDDYETLERDYGTNQDFRRFMDEAHRRGIRVIVDLVLNHTSNKHAWYVAGMNPQSHYHQFYNWSDTQPLDENGKPRHNWSKQPNGKWLYAAFSPGIPDLNVANPIVKEKLFQTAKFWLQDMKVDGFRLDAVKFLIEEGNITESSEGTHQWLRDFNAYCKSIKPDCYIVGEVWSDTKEVATYKPDQLSMCFQFNLAGAFIEAAGTGRAGFVQQRQLMVTNAFAPLQYAPFLANHDMMRSMEQLDRDPKKMSVAQALLLTAPGVPFIYYGEEVGITGHSGEGRSPMQWTAGTHSGFSTVKPYKSLEEEWEKYNVATEEADPASILSNVKSLVSLRNREAALRRGDYVPLAITPPAMLNYVLGPDAAPTQFGYALGKDGEVQFLFDPKLYGETGEIESVSVAGDFNRWAAGGWQLQKGPDGVYTTTKPASAFRLENHEFKFVIGADRWVEPPKSMPNRKHSGMTGDSYNIVLHRGPGTGIEGAKVSDGKVAFRYDPTKSTELVHGRNAQHSDTTTVPVKSVAVAGTFNDWSATALPMKAGADGVWTAEMPAAKGEFRFLVNGEYWAMASPAALNVKPTPEGSPMYAFLRALPGEAVLCIINPAEEARETDAVLGAALPDWMKARLRAVDLLTGKDFAAPTVSAAGEMAPYAAKLAPQSWALIRLTPATEAGK